MRNEEIKNEIDEIKKWKNNIKRKDLKYETNDFQKSETVKSFDNSIYTDEISINEAEMDLTNALFDTADFSKKIKTRSKEYTIKKFFLTV